jgi:flagellar biosynthesis protein FliQ
MSPDMVMTIGRQTLNITVMLCAPLLLSALAVGLLISILQAATQINETTLAFVPKLLALAAVAYFAGPWMLTLLVDYTQGMFESIPGLLG